MRLRFLALLLPLVATGCATTGQVNDTIAQVQAAAKLACGFLPTIESIALIISHSPSSQTAFQLAAAICGAVGTPPPAATASFRGLVAPAAPTLYGIDINGKFVR